MSFVFHGKELEIRMAIKIATYARKFYEGLLQTIFHSFALYIKNNFAFIFKL